MGCCYLSFVLICRALASILAPVSPMALPLMSRATRLVLLPRALSRTLVPSLRRDSATDRDWRGCKGDKEDNLYAWLAATGLVAPGAGFGEPKSY